MSKPREIDLLRVVSHKAGVLLSASPANYDQAWSELWDAWDELNKHYGAEMGFPPKKPTT